jgi:hypothetical protein
MDEEGKDHGEKGEKDAEPAAIVIEEDFCLGYRSRLQS